MQKPIDLNMDFDFGFSALDEAEVKQAEAEAVAALETATQTAEYYKKQRDAMYNMIMPLVNNLMANPEKAYIHWPNRTEKLTQFKTKLKTLTED